MSEFIFNAELRENLGKGASRRLRIAKRIPAIIYGGAKNLKPKSVSLPFNEIAKAQENDAFYSSVLTLKIGEKEEKVIIMDMQRHPYKPVVMHIDFERVTKNTIVTKRVPIHFINTETSVGVKAGGKFLPSVNEVEVKCSALSVPEFIEVDVANAEVGQTLHLTDIKVEKGITIVELTHGEDHNQAIASIVAPKGGSTEEETPAK